MKKWIKRILLLLALALTITLGIALAGLYLYRATPAWYHPATATPQQAKDAANRADQKLVDIFSWAAAAQAQAIRRRNGVSAQSDPAIADKTVTFDEAEINSFLRAWQNPQKQEWQHRLAHVFTDGRLILQDDAIILAGQSPELSTVLSAEFSPTLDARGQLHVALTGLRAGCLPVPQAAISGQMTRLNGLLEERLADYQQEAAIDRSLTANTSALGAAWIKLMLDSLNERASDPVILIPFDLTNMRRALPVKLTTMKVVPGSLTLTLQAITPDEEPQILRRVKAPYAESSSERP